MSTYELVGLECEYREVCPVWLVTARHVPQYSKSCCIRCVHSLSLLCVSCTYCCIVCVSMLQLEGKLTLLHQHLNDLVDLALVMTKALDEINTDSFQSFKLRIGEWGGHRGSCIVCVCASFPGHLYANTPGPGGCNAECLRG